jgi:hypothetical protein
MSSAGSGRRASTCCFCPLMRVGRRWNPRAGRACLLEHRSRHVVVLDAAPWPQGRCVPAKRDVRRGKARTHLCAAGASGNDSGFSAGARLPFIGSLGRAHRGIATTDRSGIVAWAMRLGAVFRMHGSAPGPGDFGVVPGNSTVLSQHSACRKDNSTCQKDESTCRKDKSAC